MDVILLSDVEKVGLRGEVVSVARGYARNYLLPRKLAEPATPARVAELERREAQRARHEAKSFEDAQEIAELEAAERAAATEDEAARAGEAEETTAAVEAIADEPAVENVEAPPEAEEPATEPAEASQGG